MLGRLRSKAEYMKRFQKKIMLDNLNLEFLTLNAWKAQFQGRIYEEVLFFLDNKNLKF